MPGAQMASRSIPTARGTILASQQGVPRGRVPASGSLQTRAPGGAPSPMIAPPLGQVPAVVVEGRSRRLGRHLGHPRGTVVPGLSRGCPPARTVQRVQPVVAHHRGSARGLLGQALEWHGDGW